MNKLTFSRTEKDFLNFSRIAAGPYRRRGIIYIIVAVGIGIALALAVIDVVRTAGYFPADKFTQTLLTTLIYFLMFYLLLRFFNAFGKQSWLAENGNFLSEKTFQMTAKGLSEESDYQRSFTDWRGVIGIQETPDYVLFYIDRMQAYLLPKSAFKNPEDIPAFLEKAHGYWQKAGGGTQAAEGKK
ncbi:MAG: YcxB family protein [Alphaproteobacteria bacterium]|nr:MAG: YcxB family protein [Alphaproteobacteria bacterium]